MKAVGSLLNVSRPRRSNRVRLKNPDQLVLNFTQGYGDVFVDHLGEETIPSLSPLNRAGVVHRAVHRALDDWKVRRELLLPSAEPHFDRTRVT